VSVAAPVAPRGAKSRSAVPAYHHGDLKNALIDAAIALIAEHGTRGLSLREAARNTGVSHAAAYRHFANKESLLAAIAEQGFGELKRVMQAAADAQRGDPGAMLDATGRAYVSFGVAHPEHLQVMFGNAISDMAEYPALAKVAAESYHVLGEVIAQGLNAGAMRSADPALIGIAAWSFVHGLALLIASGNVPGGTGSPEDLARLLGGVLPMLRHGLAAVPATVER